MRVVVQRVLQASVEVEGQKTASIGTGLLILLGIETQDTMEDADWLARKISQQRIFNDAQGVMNCSLLDVKGEVIVVSQFTLHASTKKGNRPSYIRAAKHEQAIPLYNYFIKQLENSCSNRIQSGKFGADMKINLLNDGPVTIILENN